VQEGINIVELADLPPAMRKIIRLVLNEPQITHAAIHDSAEEVLLEDNISQSELDELLDTLCKRRWLIPTIEDNITSYKVNLRRKPGHTVFQGIWGALGMEDTVNENVLRRGGNRKLPDNIWGKLALEGDVISEPTAPSDKKRTTSILAQNLWEAIGSVIDDDKPSTAGTDQPAPNQSD